MVARRGNVAAGIFPFGDFTSILINPRNGDEIFAGNAYQISEVGGGVYRSTKCRARRGRESIRRADVYRVRESGRWRLMHTIRTCFLWVRTQRACTWFRETSTRPSAQ